MKTDFRARFVVLATFLASGVSAQDLPHCDRFPVGEEQYACECPAGEVSGSVWGTDIYTADSNVCAAARHAGVVTNQGGGVLALAREGQEEYPASAANGVESSRWGAYSNSFAFDPKGPRYVIAGSIAACGRFDTSLEVMQCSCPAGISAGTVWGSGPYTADSDICAAAQHAGVLNGLGGDVTVMRFVGLEAYFGSERNDVTSQDWRAYGTSIVIDANSRP